MEKPPFSVENPLPFCGEIVENFGALVENFFHISEPVENSGLFPQVFHNLEMARMTIY